MQDFWGLKFLILSNILESKMDIFLAFFVLKLHYIF